MKFTSNEKTILDLYIKEIGDLEYWLEDQGSLVLAYSDFTGCDIKEESLKGVIGSLVKKGLLFPDDDFTPQMKKEGFEQSLFLNENYVKQIAASL